MYKTISLLVLFMLGILLCPAGRILADDSNGQDMPELFNSTGQAIAFEIGTGRVSEPVRLVVDPNEPCE